jgi:DNA-binding MarR family transcriptional regulator
MNTSATSLNQDRMTCVHELARILPNRAARLSRLAMRHVGVEITRSQASLLAAVAERPRRVTELAEYEGLPQPRVTMLVGELERRGWVKRTPDPVDRRAVTVAMTARGDAVLTQMRNDVITAVEASLTSMSPDQVRALLAATEAVEALINALEPGGER